jgi:hypothetical protein
LIFLRLISGFNCNHSLLVDFHARDEELLHSPFSVQDEALRVLGQVLAAREHPSHESAQFDFMLSVRIDTFTSSVILSEIVMNSHVRKDLTDVCLADVAAESRVDVDVSKDLVDSLELLVHSLQE